MIVTDELRNLVPQQHYIQLEPPQSDHLSSKWRHVDGASITFDVSVSDAQDQADEISLDWTLDGQPYSGFSHLNGYCTDL